MLWLAGFWRQQLSQGRAWTTAGLLIPSVRLLGQVAAGACLWLAAADWIAQREPAGAWLAVSTCALLLLLAAMLAHATPESGLAGCLAAAAILVPAGALAGEPVPLSVLVATVALLWSLCTPAGRELGSQAVANAMVYGFLPVPMLYAST